jgi:hypothetical protein
MLPLHESLKNRIKKVDELLAVKMDGTSRTKPDITLDTEGEFLQILGLVREYRVPRFTEGTKFSGMFRWLIYFQPDNTIRSRSHLNRELVMYAWNKGMDTANSWGTFGSLGGTKNVDAVQHAVDSMYNDFMNTMVSQPDKVYMQISNWFGGDNKFSEEAVRDYLSTIASLAKKHQSEMKENKGIPLDHHDINLLTDFAERMFSRQIRMAAWILNSQTMYKKELINEHIGVDSAAPDAVSFYQK